MEIALNLYKVMNKYKELLNSFDEEKLSFNEAIILYSVSMGVTEKKEITSFLEKDRSQIHRILKHMVEEGILSETSSTFSLTDKGYHLYKRIEGINNVLYSANKYEELKNLKKSLTSFDNTISSLA